VEAIISSYNTNDNISPIAQVGNGRHSNIIKDIIYTQSRIDNILNGLTNNANPNDSNVK